MRLVFSDEARMAYALRVEVALAQVEARLGIIPQQASDEIARRAPGLQVNWERLRQDAEGAGYPVLPYLSQLGEACGGASEYLHWGSTTHDVTETALVLQLRDAMALIERDALRVRGILLGMAEAYQSSVMVARTHGVQAAPTTFGFICATWLTELDRQLERLTSVRAGLGAGQFGGAVGTLAALGERGLEVQQELMRELGLQAPPDHCGTPRDRISEVVFMLAMVSSSMANIARTIVTMTRSEVQELREPAPLGRVPAGPGQQAPHTVGCELVMVHARMATQNVSTVMESMVQDHERNWQGHFETLLLPQTFLLVHAAVSQMAAILAGLEVFPNRMRANLDATRGLVMAESVMMRLARKSGRRSAFRLITRICEAAQERQCSLRDALLASAEVTSKLTVQEIDEALDPARHLGSGPQIVARLIAAAQDGNGEAARVHSMHTPQGRRESAEGFEPMKLRAS